jgi:hypothetical protein
MANVATMARYKGRQSPKANERAFPHIVEMAVPLGGLGRQLDAMYSFHGERGIPSRHGRGRREGEQDFIRWCFADAATADAFVLAFGGKLIVPPMPKDNPAALMEWGKRFIQGD